MTSGEPSPETKVTPAADSSYEATSRKLIEMALARETRRVEPPQVITIGMDGLSEGSRIVDIYELEQRCLVDVVIMPQIVSRLEAHGLEDDLSGADRSAVDRRITEILVRGAQRAGLISDAPLDRAIDLGLGIDVPPEV